ncbi:hypothetical protein [Bradyrhizobium sp. CCGUVB14]|uniref:hypothetical protein n=1 Tax=Bradyrhizobium sp. CCGUVB14 TaxID=2949628 RepID=UPI0020B41DF1|nr:hypothetical protein [Bradyrhizobium sp. CCGUVB14]MCP3446158.1 hypothetical protein [Bradyrhizobium sp. CCGUVB14]
MIDFVKSILGRELPPDAALWHRWRLFVPFVRDVNGAWILSDEIWRRRRNGRWEYSRRPPTYDDYLDRAW